VVVLFLISCEKDPTVEEVSDFQPTTEFDLSLAGYTSYNLEGFHILIAEEVFEFGVSEIDDFLYFLQEDLQLALLLNLNEGIKAFFLEVPIFIDKETGITAAYYNPALPEDTHPDNIKRFPKNGGITISNINNYRDWSLQNQPYIMLHELSHAFHDQVLGFDNVDIQDAYDQAIQNDLYTNVLYDAGDGNTYRQKFAYAHSNPIEFFAEATEAYFGKNDFFPFGRSDLRRYDPLTFSVLEKVWEQE